MSEPIARVGYLAGLCGYTGADWQKLQMLWGYYDRWAELVSNLDAATGENNLNSAAVLAGYVHVLLAAWGQDNTSDPGVVDIRVWDGTQYHALAYETPGGIAIPALWAGMAVLKEGDKANVRLRGCTLHDDLYAGFIGYKMRLDL